jgi:hypothetical protein
LQVHQADPTDLFPIGTDGKMLSVILDHTVGFAELSAVGKDEERIMARQCNQLLLMLGIWHFIDELLTFAQVTNGPFWKALLDQAVELKCHALLDCGALLVGATNRWVF